MSHSSLAVWSSWPLHADVLVAALEDVGGRPVVVADPDDAEGILVAAIDAPDVVGAVRARARVGRETVVWGGTLPPHRVDALRRAGASAYVSALALPRELAEVVGRVQDGAAVEWPSVEAAVVRLTAREREVALAYLVTEADRTRSEVARGLGISERTLKVHIARVRDKAGHEGTATREGLHHELVTRGWFT